MPGAMRHSVWGTPGAAAHLHVLVGCLCACWRWLTRYSLMAACLLPCLTEWCWAPWGQTTEAQAGSSPGFRKWVKDFQQQTWATAQPRPLCSPPSPGFRPCPYHVVPTTPRRLPPQTTLNHNFLAKTLGSPEGQWKFIIFCPFRLSPSGFSLQNA